MQNIVFPYRFHILRTVTECWFIAMRIVAIVARKSFWLNYHFSIANDSRKHNYWINFQLFSLLEDKYFSAKRIFEEGKLPFASHQLWIEIFHVLFLPNKIRIQRFCFAWILLFSDYNPTHSLLQFDPTDLSKILILPQNFSKNVFKVSIKCLLQIVYSVNFILVKLLVKLSSLIDRYKYNFVLVSELFSLSLNKLDCRQVIAQKKFNERTT